MAASLKRKASPEMDDVVESMSPAKRQETRSLTPENPTTEASNDDDQGGAAIAPTNTSSMTEDEDEDNPKQNEDTTATTQPINSRLAAQRERFASLQKRQAHSRTTNRKEATLESQRASTNPAALTSLQRKKATAEQKLARADAEAAGEDYERKRAWDWTIDESERWDRRMAKKGAHRDDVAFASYGQDARKVYKRQLRELGKADVEGYEAEKAAAVRKAADEGRLELVEREDGEVIAVDKEGSWYSGRESLDVVGKGRVEKEKVDRLVGELKKAEEVRLRKTKQRRGQDDREDVTYINEKNKVCLVTDPLASHLC